VVGDDAELPDGVSLSSHAARRRAGEREGVPVDGAMHAQGVVP
jgi:hypothetical protein